MCEPRSGAQLDLERQGAPFNDSLQVCFMNVSFVRRAVVVRRGPPETEGSAGDREPSCEGNTRPYVESHFTPGQLHARAQTQEAGPGQQTEEGLVLRASDGQRPARVEIEVR